MVEYCFDMVFINFISLAYTGKRICWGDVDVECDLGGNGNHRSGVCGL